MLKVWFLDKINTIHSKQNLFRGDETQTGHILGQAGRRGQLKPERQLTPVYCAAVRLILHMAMYVGAGTNEQVSYFLSGDKHFF